MVKLHYTLFCCSDTSTGDWGPGLSFFELQNKCVSHKTSVFSYEVCDGDDDNDDDDDDDDDNNNDDDADDDAVDDESAAV